VVLKTQFKPGFKKIKEAVNHSFSSLKAELIANIDIKFTSLEESLLSGEVLRCCPRQVSAEKPSYS